MQLQFRLFSSPTNTDTSGSQQDSPPTTRRTPSLRELRDRYREIDQNDSEENSRRTHRQQSAPLGTSSTSGTSQSTPARPRLLLSTIHPWEPQPSAVQLKGLTIKGRHTPGPSPSAQTASRPLPPFRGSHPTVSQQGTGAPIPPNRGPVRLYSHQDTLQEVPTLPSILRPIFYSPMHNSANHSPFVLPAIRRLQNTSYADILNMFTRVRNPETGPHGRRMHYQLHPTSSSIVESPAPNTSSTFGIIRYNNGTLYIGQVQERVSANNRPTFLPFGEGLVRAHNGFTYFGFFNEDGIISGSGLIHNRNVFETNNMLLVNYDLTGYIPAGQVEPCEVLSNGTLRQLPEHIRAQIPHVLQMLR